MDEFEVIQIIRDKVLGKKLGAEIIGDDVSFLKEKGNIVAKTDMLVSTTDMPPRMSLAQAAKKAVAMCVSDFAAKGVKPDSYLISLGIPKGCTKRDVFSIARGLKEASERWSVALIGGDTNLTKEFVIACTMFGFSDRIVRRKGAGTGELVVTNGYFGYTAAGLRILLGKATGTSEFERKAISSVLEPEPRLEDGLILSKYLTSSMDSSDGLAISLYTLAESNNVGIRLTKIPTNMDVKQFATRNGLRVEDLVFFGGEEYLVVGTMRKNDFMEAKRELKKVGGKLIAFGYTERGKGVFLGLEKSLSLPKKGWVYSF